MDILKFIYRDNVTIRFGGVCNNVACALGTFGLTPKFVTVRFNGEIGSLVGDHLKSHNVEWFPIEKYASLALFSAELDEKGNIHNEEFYDSHSLKLIKSSDIEQLTHTISENDLIITCTDLEIDTINYLSRTCQDLDIPLWVLSTSQIEAYKLAHIIPKPSGIGLNIKELKTIFQHLQDEVDNDLENVITTVSENLLADNGLCLLTLGNKGAVLIDKTVNKAYFQSVIPIEGYSTLGAGDVLFAGVVSAYLKNQQSITEDNLKNALMSTLSYIKSYQHGMGNSYLAIKVFSEEIVLPEMKHIAFNS